MGGPKFDITTPKGLSGFNGFMGSKSYLEGWSYSQADSDFFAKFASAPDAKQYPNAYRWYIHIAALKGVRGLYLSAAPTPASAPAKEGKSAPKKKDDDDDFDVFGDDDEEEEAEEESRADSKYSLII